MTTKDLPPVLRTAWVWLLSIGALTMILGITMLAWPGPSILVASVMLGIYLVASGVAEVILAFSLQATAAHRILLFIGGALSLILGLLAFRHFGQGTAVLLLALWIGIGFIFQGVATASTAISHPELPGRGWHMFFGAVSVIAGIIMTASPFGSLLTLAVVAGCWLIAIGSVQVIAAIATRIDLGKANRPAAAEPEISKAA